MIAIILNKSIRWLEQVGIAANNLFFITGRLVVLFSRTLILIFKPPFRFSSIFQQMDEIGVNSILVVFLTSAFTGMVLALQSFTGFKRFGAESMVGTVVALSMTREMGPVLTGLIVTARAGSSMAAELGTMKVTEQIDALYCLATDPVKYLIVPRFIASAIMLPMLTILSDLVGFIGGYVVAVIMLDSPPNQYINKALEYLKLNDVFSGLIKAAVFGMIIALICCYQGFYTKGGAEGVGKATTKAVVVSSILILIANYFVTALLFNSPLG